MVLNVECPIEKVCYPVFRQDLKISTIKKKQSKSQSIIFRVQSTIQQICFIPKQSLYDKSQI